MGDSDPKFSHRSSAAHNMTCDAQLGLILFSLLEGEDLLPLFKSGGIYEESSGFYHSVHAFRDPFQVNPFQDVNSDGSLGVKENERSEESLTYIGIQQFTDKAGFVL